jgi:hypothetical protein
LEWGGTEFSSIFDDDVSRCIGEASAADRLPIMRLPSLVERLAGPLLATRFGFASPLMPAAVVMICLDYVGTETSRLEDQVFWLQPHEWRGCVRKPGDWFGEVMEGCLLRAADASSDPTPAAKLIAAEILGSGGRLRIDEHLLRCVQQNGHLTAPILRRVLSRKAAAIVAATDIQPRLGLDLHIENDQDDLHIENDQDPAESQKANHRGGCTRFRLRFDDRFCAPWWLELSGRLGPILRARDNHQSITIRARVTGSVYAHGKARLSANVAFHPSSPDTLVVNVQDLNRAPAFTQMADGSWQPPPHLVPANQHTSNGEFHLHATIPVCWLHPARPRPKTTSQYHPQLPD